MKCKTSDQNYIFKKKTKKNKAMLTLQNDILLTNYPFKCKSQDKNQEWRGKHLFSLLMEKRALKYLRILKLLKA